jgi:hypothetical protein
MRRKSILITIGALAYAACLALLLLGLAILPDRLSQEMDAFGKAPPTDQPLTASTISNGEMREPISY